MYIKQNWSVMFSTFISYRRDGGASTASRLYMFLQLHGYEPFYDKSKMESGRFDEQLRNRIIQSNNFILILSKNSLNRCIKKDDWVKEEIKTALEHNLNIVILQEENFVFPEQLPKEIEVIKYYHMFQYTEENLDRDMHQILPMIKKKHLTNINTSTNKFKISGEYITSYEDEVDGQHLIIKAPATLKRFGNTIRGITQFDDQKWILKGKLYENKRYAGLYYAENKIDDGFGTFYLEIKDNNTLKGYWAGYDNKNQKINSGKYVFKKKIETAIRKAKKHDYSSISPIADVQLGKDYLTRQIFSSCLKSNNNINCLVADDADNNSICGFAIFKLIDKKELKSITKGHDIEQLCFEDSIGYLRTIAVAPEYTNQGIASHLAKNILDYFKNNNIKCIISTAWKHAGIINISSILEHLGFDKVIEIPNYWHEDSIKEGFMCPQCGNPCTCSCVIYGKFV